MTVRVRVTERGLTEAAAEVDMVASRLSDLTPTAWMIRRRWHESERRTFAAGRWPARSASTRARYRRGRIGTGMGAQRRTVSGPRGGTLVLSGRLRTVLTTPHQRGQLDRVRRTSGGLSVTLGVAHNGPAGYAATLARRGRDPVEIDERAVGAATEDVSSYIVSGRVGRWARAPPSPTPTGTARSSTSSTSHGASRTRSARGRPSTCGRSSDRHRASRRGRPRR